MSIARIVPACPGMGGPGRFVRPGWILSRSTLFAGGFMPRPATDKRKRLADAALDLAYLRGFERASISDIAEHAGVASGSVYYYFKSKDDVAGQWWNGFPSATCRQRRRGVIFPS